MNESKRIRMMHTGYLHLADNRVYVDPNRLSDLCKLWKGDKRKFREKQLVLIQQRSQALHRGEGDTAYELFRELITMEYVLESKSTFSKPLFVRG